MGFTRRIDIDLDHHTAVAATKAALQDQGFGTLTEIDVRQTLKDKLDVDTDPQVIIGACNPSWPTAPSASTHELPRCCPATSWSAPSTAAPSSRRSTRR
jgi:Domain of unknown function DUF302